MFNKKVHVHVRPLRDAEFFKRKFGQFANTKKPTCDPYFPSLVRCTKHNARNILSKVNAVYVVEKD